MEFFSGFSWAVPTAFADAVALCRSNKVTHCMTPEKPMKKAGPMPRSTFIIGCKFGIPLMPKQ